MRKIYPSKGLRAWVDLSTFCNAGCPQCHRTDPNGLGKVGWLPLVQWSLDDFKRAFPVESLASYETIEVCGTWGDPIMCKDILPIVEYIIDNSLLTKVQINTNASMRSEEWWWDLGVAGGDRLTVVFDIDGINQEMHSKYRQGTNLWKIKQNVEMYCSTQARAIVMIVVFEHNQNYIDDIKQMVRDWGVKGDVFMVESNRFYWGPTQSFTDADGNEVILTQTTKKSNQFSNTTVKDHRWRKEFDASGRTNAAL